MENGTEETQENQEPQIAQNEFSQPEDLEAIKAQLQEEAQARAALETAAAEKDTRIAELEAALSEAKSESEAALAETARLKDAEAATVGKYREALVAAHPDIPQDLIQGESVSQLFASVEKGRATVEAVRKSLEAEASATRVPAGAPTRGGISLEGMSPRDKIAYAIQQKGGSSA
jgi:vacuolar-type H+-ATPase subunit I/STV1